MDDSTVGKITSPVMELIFSHFGLKSEQQRQKYLFPQLRDLPSPWLMRDMERAVSLIVRAHEQQRTVVVYGDYDVDGTCAAVLLENFFSHCLGLHVLVQQPHRLLQGYGVHAEDVRALAQKAGANPLLVTVDCGISAAEELALARQLGFSVLVTDHHHVPPRLPPADAILNPKQEGCPFPNKDIAGVGVAFFLLVALRSRLLERGLWNRTTVPNLKQYLDLVALGTIADVVPLRGTNRILVKGGMDVLRENPRPGLQALLESTGLNRETPGGRDIAFQLTPRLNAASRLGEVEVARELLMAQDHTNGKSLVERINTLNLRRRELTEMVLDEARQQLRARCQVAPIASAVVWGAWHLGVAGIVAARLMDEYECPVVVLCQQGNKFKGSVRATVGIDAYAALAACSELLEHFGGHAAAGGVTMPQASLAAFVDGFDKAVRAQHGCFNEATGKLDNVLRVTCQHLTDRAFLHQYCLLEPFGAGNEEPIFCLEDVTLCSPRVFGKKRNHLGFYLECAGERLEGIAYNKAQWYDVVCAGQAVQLHCLLRPTGKGSRPIASVQAVVIKNND